MEAEITHQSCDIKGGCGSSDAMTINMDGSRKCYSCGRFEPAPAGNHDKRTDMKEKPTASTLVEQTQEAEAIADRRITVFAAKKYGVKTGKEGKLYFPYHDESGKLVAYKVRRPDKTMHSEGTIKDAVLFGQHLFPAGCAKTITIVEGEFDALSSYDLQGSKYPVVSIKNGAQAALADCKRSFQYLNGFDSIVVNFDNDEPGQKAAAEVCALFSGKARNLKLNQHKDANDYLMENKRQAYKDEWWAAGVYVPAGIIRGSELHHLVTEPVALPIARYPWDGFNLMTYGIRKGELITLAAGSGIGKSTIVRQVMEHIIATTDLNMGYLPLEDGVDAAAQGLMGLSVNKRLHLPTRQQMIDYVLNDPKNIVKKPELGVEVTQAEREEAFQKVLASDRITFLGSKGDSSVDTVCNNITYMVKGLDCPLIFLDHISILVGLNHARRGGDEREAIDDTMHRLRSITDETGATIFILSHLSKPQGGGAGHEEGGRVRLSQLRGSAAIAQLSNLTLVLERNNQADNEDERDTMIARVLKNRFSGDGGIATALKWDPARGRHIETILNEEAIDYGDAL